MLLVFLQVGTVFAYVKSQNQTIFNHIPQRRGLDQIICSLQRCKRAT